MHIKALRGANSINSCRKDSQGKYISVELTSIRGNIRSKGGNLLQGYRLSPFRGVTLAVWAK